jgi:cephalosporin hydroxylase
VSSTIARFHRLYYDNSARTWVNTRWLGVGVEKCPLDLWAYQELIVELRPDLVIETGTRHGGSALFLASCLDLVGNGHVITVDVEATPHRPDHPRITYVKGSSTDPEVVDSMRQAAAGAATVMVILDSDHSRNHVLAELRAYSPLVTPASYVIVEDSNINGHPVLPGWGPGPHEAIEAFLTAQPQFVRDRGPEKFYLTFNPGGYLRRVEHAEA